MFAKFQMSLIASVIGGASLIGLVYAYAMPPESMRVTREGLAHFAPLVMHPETAEGVPLRALVEHYKGG